jgi:hypothetical protein
MITAKKDYSIKSFSKSLSTEIKKAIKDIKSHGSVEIFIQEGEVTQITTRNIHKTQKNGKKRSS